MLVLTYQDGPRFGGQVKYELVRDTPKENFRAVRVMLPSRPGDPYYVFLLLPRPEDRSYEEYREVRRNLLANYCSVVNLKNSDAQDIVGIATETGLENETRSEDVAYFDVSVWTEADRMEAQSIADELRLLAEIRQFEGVEYEFPDVPTKRMKGGDRNRPCPCGSGRKYKRCCGR